MLTFTFDRYTLQASGDYHNVVAPLQACHVPPDKEQDETVGLAVKRIVGACLLAHIGGQDYIKIQGGFRAVNVPDDDHTPADSTESRLRELVRFLNTSVQEQGQTVHLGALFDRVGGGDDDGHWTVGDEIADLYAKIA